MKLARFRFSISKVISYVPRVKLVEKIVYVKAQTMQEARELFYMAFPDWQVNMLWPMTDKNGKVIYTNK